jgi:flagellar protein FliL
MKTLIKYLIIATAVLGLPGGLYLAGLISIGKPATEGPVDEHGDPIPAATAGASEPLYLPMDPPFVVNFQHRGSLHYLQLEMQLMYHDQKILDTIEARMPAVRNELILLFSNQDFETLISSEGKEMLRDRIVQAVNSVAGVEPDQETGQSDGKVYLTHFVMQ